LEATLLPDDDAQARYFGLCTLALGDIAWMQDLGLLIMPDARRVIEDAVVGRIQRECRMRGFNYSHREVAEKGWELVRQWAGFYEVLPEQMNG
jgi:hypothetical protein